MKEVVLEDYRIEALAAKPDVVATFPFLADRIVDTSSCCRNRRKRNHVNYERAKREFAALPEEGRQRLKEILKTESVLIYVSGVGGVVTAVRF